MFGHLDLTGDFQEDGANTGKVHYSLPRYLNINFHGIHTTAEPGIKGGVWILYKLYTASEDPVDA